MFFLAPIRWCLRLGKYVFLAAVAYVIVTGVQVELASHASSDPNNASNADTIVVFAAPVSNGAPGQVLEQRLQQAVSLVSAGKAGTIVVTGPASSVGSESTTAVAAHWLTTKGIPASDIRTIVASNNAEALSQIRSLLGPGASAIVVTDAVDALWTRGDGADSGVRTQVSPPQSSKLSIFANLDPFLQQTTGVATGRIVGYGRVFWADH